MSAPKKNKKTPLKFIEYVFIRIFYFCLSIIPFRIRAFLTEKLGLLLYYLVSSYRKKVLDNLSYAFPEKPHEWKIKTAKQNFRNLGRFLSEFVQLKYLSNSFYKKWLVVDEEAIKNEIKDGCIAILGHLGNWEWYGAYTASFWPDKVYTLAKRQSNYWADKFIDKIRQVQGLKIIYTNESPVKIMRKARAKKVLAFIADQDASRKGIYVKFMGQPAATFMGPAIFARTADLPVCFFWSYHDEKKRLVLKSEKVKMPNIDKEKDPHKWEIEFTKNWVRLLEEKAKENPQDYFWVHSRWKTKPFPEDVVYE
ncbi:MAG: hypothetical protein OEZ13_10930 [Spirochaetia bacterium]|nr:hypothetical protein [Spirochaetia bacterium]